MMQRTHHYRTRYSSSNVYSDDAEANTGAAVKKKRAGTRMPLSNITNATTTHAKNNKQGAIKKPSRFARSGSTRSGLAAKAAGRVKRKVEKTSTRRRASVASMDAEEIDEDGMDIDHSIRSTATTKKEEKEDVVDPVDLPDIGDAQACAEYAVEIMEYLKRIETRRMPSAFYMDMHTDINSRMREILIDWLVEVHFKFKLRHETLFLTVHLIDRFLEKQTVSRTKLQLVGCTAMLLASKYEEIYAPEVRDFVYISANAYTREQILRMEAAMLKSLNFNLVHPSPLRFVERYAKVAGGDEQFEHLANYLIELTLQKYGLLRFKPSEVAASAVYLAQRILSRNAQWSSTMVKHTGFTEDDIENCSRQIMILAQDPEPKYGAVKRKYSSRQFMSVSKINCKHVII